MGEAAFAAPSHLDEFHFMGWHTYLFVKLHEGWLKEFLDVLLLFAHVVWILNVTQAFVHNTLLWQEVSFDLSGQSMEWHHYVLGIADLLELDMGNLFVVHIGWVMCWYITGQFWEVRSHI